MHDEIKNTKTIFLKRILRNNYIGKEELNKIVNHFSVRIPACIPEIPFNRQEIIEKQNTHLLLLCVPYFLNGEKITINAMRKRINLFKGLPCFYNQDWYLKEQFIYKPLELKWLLVAKNLMDESRGMTVDSILSRYKLHSAVELTFAFFANYFINNGEKLWNNDYVWCSDVDDKGDQIYIGRYTDASGLNKDGFEIHRHLRIKSNYGVV